MQIAPLACAVENSILHDFDDNGHFKNPLALQYNYSAISAFFRIEDNYSLYDLYLHLSVYFVYQNSNNRSI